MAFRKWPCTVPCPLSACCPVVRLCATPKKVQTCRADNEVKVLGVAKHRPPPDPAAEAAKSPPKPSPPQPDPAAVAAARQKKEEEESSAHKDWVRQYLLQQVNFTPLRT